MTILPEQLHDDRAAEELINMGSFNHGYLQLKIGSFFINTPDFTPSSELSLDVSALASATLPVLSGPLKPDIAVYAGWSVDFQNDILTATTMPVLAIDIVSPMQGVKTVVDTFKYYFARGIQSCWLVYPYAEAIAVYHAPNVFTLFAQGDVEDAVVHVRIPLHDIFR